MTQTQFPCDWSSGRAEKWRANVEQMEAMLAPITEPLVRALQLDAAYRVADIGCGGGGATLEVHNLAPAGSTICGYDLSDALLEAARSHPQPGCIRFVTCNVETSAPPGGSVERLLSRFGVMFFEEPQRAFHNLLRWLVPGGRFAFSVWGLPTHNPWVLRVRDVVSEFIDMPAPIPDTPGPFRYGDATILTALLEAAGFVDIRREDWYGRLPMGGPFGPEEAAMFALYSFSDFKERLYEVGEGAFEEAHKRLTARFDQHVEDGIVQMAAHVHLITGARPSKNTARQ